MKFYKLGLLTLLISLFILNSCKTQDGIGLDPDTQIKGSMVTDTGMIATTVPEDSVVTNNLFARAPLAYFKDTDFGTTEANIAAVLSLPGRAAYTKPTGEISIDSARLVLPYSSNGFYGDSLISTFKVDVHQLTENIVASKSYYNTKHFAFNPDQIGTKTFYARAHDSIRIYQIIKGAPDTLRKVRPQVRIPIDPQFIYTNFFNASASALASNPLFENNTKGIYLTIDKNHVTDGAGGNMFFSLDSAALVVYYKLAVGSTVDTASIALPLGVNVNEIKHTYTANVQAALDKTSTDGNVYMQGLLGLKAKLTFPNVKTMFDSIQNKVIINRAELIVKVRPGTTTPFAPNKRLTLYKYDIAHQRINLQDASTSDPRASVFGGQYDPATGEYHFIVTAYMQDLIRGKTVDYGTFLAPTDPTTANIDITATPSYAERSILVGKDSPYRIRLKIIYTKLNQ
ncbi:DUF4270 domain-containing protein [Mucilaginibacter terrigena]|uniref:DUF4270 domain-containing protein n=1 Tax=Mucilaginibacter terrigena TaxID=2492395 RepID=A0A4V1ZBK7_9SPHI|nr:DUF4270 domain-containing protein [Mucilaginibacter terrigena]RYU89267.1 DUF4270 domain-containing protein [Mucilaginibacter terrigena]